MVEKTGMALNLYMYEISEKEIEIIKRISFFEVIEK